MLLLGLVNLGVECGHGGEITDEEFWRDHHDVFIVMFSFVVHEGS